jgi:uncharacterized membrane protein
MDTNQPAASNGPNLPTDSTPTQPKQQRSIRDRIIGGLLLAMPLLITLWIIGWLYSILDHYVIQPLAGVIMLKLHWTTSLRKEDLPDWFEYFVAPVIAIVLALLILYTLDLLADTGLHRGISWALKRVPVFSHIYNPIQGAFQSLEQGADQPQMKRMVLVTFPHRGVKLPAFVTGSCRDLTTGKTVLCLYVPTTPVPTSGFFLLVPEEEVTELNWNTEQTLQAVMSGGLSCPREVSYFSLNNHSDNPVPALGSSEDQARPQGS